MRPARHGEAGRLVDLTAQIEHGQARDGPEREQEPPDEVVRHTRGQQDRSEQGAEDQAEALHGEHEPDHAAARLLARVLAHDRGRDRVVAADADPEDDPAHDEERVAGREGGRDRADGEDEDLVAVIRLRPSMSAIRPNTIAPNAEASRVAELSHDT